MIDNYSNYELELIIQFTNYNRAECVKLIDNSDKEVILKSIEEWRYFNLNISNDKILYTKTDYNQDNLINSDEENKNNLFENNDKQINNIVFISKYKGYKQDYISNSIDSSARNHLQLIKTPSIIVNSDVLLNNITKKPTIYKVSYISKELLKPFEFLKQNLNIIDIRDYLKCIDHHELINKAIKEVKDKDNKKLNKFFEKFDQERITKIKALWSHSIEPNDIKLIFNNDEFKDIYSNIINTNKKSGVKYQNENSFQYYMTKKLNPFLLSLLIEYSGLPVLYTLSCCNKAFKKTVDTKINKENLSKRYCEAVFENSRLYNNDLKFLKANYNSYFDMLKNRERVKFGGLYYSIVKFVKKCDSLTFTTTQSLQTVIYFRYLQFFPDGSIACFTCPNKNSKKVLKDLNSNIVDLKRGIFYVDYNCLITQFEYGKDTDIVYFYEMIKKEVDMMEYSVLKLLRCELKDKDGGSSEFKLGENFPRLFKYRSLKTLENNYFIKSTEE